MRAQFYFPFSVVLNIILIILLLKCCSEPNETTTHTERKEETTIALPDTNKVQGGKLTPVSAHTVSSPRRRSQIPVVENQSAAAAPADSTLGICDSVTDYRYQYSDSNITVDVVQQIRGSVEVEPSLYYRLKVPKTITRTITEREFVSADKKSLRLYGGGSIMQDSSGIRLGIAGQMTFPSTAYQVTFYPSGKVWQATILSRLFRK